MSSIFGFILFCFVVGTFVSEILVYRNSINFLHLRCWRKLEDVFFFFNGENLINVYKLYVKGKVQNTWIPKPRLMGLKKVQNNVPQWLANMDREDRMIDESLQAQLNPSTHANHSRLPLLMHKFVNILMAAFGITLMKTDKWVQYVKTKYIHTRVNIYVYITLCVCVHKYTKIFS